MFYIKLKGELDVCEKKKEKEKNGNIIIKERERESGEKSENSLRKYGK